MSVVQERIRSLSQAATASPVQKPAVAPGFSSPVGERLEYWKSQEAGGASAPASADKKPVEIGSENVGRRVSVLNKAEEDAAVVPPKPAAAKKEKAAEPAAAKVAPAPKQADAPKAKAAAAEPKAEQPKKAAEPKTEQQKKPEDSKPKAKAAPEAAAPKPKATAPAPVVKKAAAPAPKPSAPAASVAREQPASSGAIHSRGPSRRAVKTARNKVRAIKRRRANQKF